MLLRFDPQPIPSSPASVPGFFVAGITGHAFLVAGFCEMRRQTGQNLTPKPIAPQ